jgi:hypothetical protein
MPDDFDEGVFLRYHKCLSGHLEAVINRIAHVKVESELSSARRRSQIQSTAKSICD